MSITPTLSWIEALWILAGLICLPATIHSLRWAVANRAALRRVMAARAAAGRPPLAAGYQRSADLDVRWRAVAGVIQAVLLGVGLRAACYPPANGGGLSWDTWLVGGGFLLMQGLLVWVAVRNDADEARLRQEYRAAMQSGRPDPREE